MGDLHFVDGFDEIEECLGAFGFVGDFTSSVISWIEDGIIFQIFEDAAIDIEFLSCIHAESV